MSPSYDLPLSYTISKQSGRNPGSPYDMGNVTNHDIVVSSNGSKHSKNIDATNVLTSETLSSSEKQSEPSILVLENGLSQPLHDDIDDAYYKAGRILKITTDGASCITIVENADLYLPDGIDVDRVDQRIYWTNMGVPAANDGSIQSCRFDGSDMKTVLSPGQVHTPKQLVVDHQHRKLYFSDREGLRVMRCNLDGTDLETLIRTGDWTKKEEQADKRRWCVGIAVSHKYGKIYWTQKGQSKGNQGRIYSASIDCPRGQCPSTRDDITCLIDDLPEPIDLEVNESAETLIWTDRGEVPLGNTLNSVALDARGDVILRKGSPRYKVLAQNFDEAIGLKLDPCAKHVYVADLGGTIWRCDTSGSNKVMVYQDKSCAFTGIVVV